MVNQVQEKFIAVARMSVTTHVNVYRERQYHAAHFRIRTRVRNYDLTDVI